MKDFSQSGEQKIILNHFGVFVGTVLDIGANDGVTFSMSRALIELGWRAVLVEPATLPFRKLELIYIMADRVKLVQAAITTQDGPLDFYSSGTHLKKGDTDLLSTTQPSELARWKKSGEVFTKTTVRGITFETLMRETGVNRFDFISIDAEGVDLEILRQIDLTAVGCKMVCVEVNRNDEAPFMAHFAKHGFKLHHRNYENLIAVKQ